jgi:hypothetical protein
MSAMIGELRALEIAEAACTQYGLAWHSQSASAELHKNGSDDPYWIVTVGSQAQTWIEQETDEVPRRLHIDAETGECLRLEMGPRGRTFPVASLRMRKQR